MFKINKEMNSALSELQGDLEAKSAHWIGNHPDHDDGEDYCRGCCKKAVEQLLLGKTSDGEDQLTEDQVAQVKENEPFLDGGWSSDKDLIPRCNGCGVILDATMTDTAIEEELSHYESIKGDIEISSSEGAYDFLELLGSVTENSTNAKRVSVISERLVVKQPHVTEDESQEGTLACGCGITRCEC